MASPKEKMTEKEMKTWVSCSENELNRAPRAATNPPKIHTDRGPYFRHMAAMSGDRRAPLPQDVLTATAVKEKDK